MAFIYDVEITTHSIIQDTDGGLPVGEEEITVTTNRGFMKIEEGRTTLSYSESAEGVRVVTEIILLTLPREVCTACPDSTEPRYRVELTKHGGIESRMAFELGKTEHSLYSVPPYSFDMTLTPTSIRPSLTKEGGVIRLGYEMALGGQTRSTRLNIKVKRL